jgi:hypothetical protein
MVIFKFKQKRGSNQITPHRYRLSAPVTDGTTISIDPASSNASGTTHPERPVPIKAIGPATSTPLAGTNRADPGSVGTDCHWNQPRLSHHQSTESLSVS